MIRGSLTIHHNGRDHKCDIVGVQNVANIRLDYNLAGVSSLFYDLSIPQLFLKFIKGTEYTNNFFDTIHYVPTEIPKSSSTIKIMYDRDNLWYFVTWLIKYSMFYTEHREYLVESTKIGDIYNIEEELIEAKSNLGTYEKEIENQINITEDNKTIKIKKAKAFKVQYKNVLVNIITSKGVIQSYEAFFTIGNAQFELRFMDDKDFKCELLRIKKFDKSIKVPSIFENHMSEKEFQQKLDIGVTDIESLLVDLDLLIKKKGLEWIHEQDWRFIETTEDFFKFLEVLKAHKLYEPHKRLGMDFETTGLKMYSISRDRHPKSDRPVGIVMGFEGEPTVYYITIYHSNLPNCLTENIEPYHDQIVEAIKELRVEEKYKKRAIDNIPEYNDWAIMALLKPYVETFNMANANVGFDWRCGWVYGVNINYVSDTQIAGHLNRNIYGPNPKLKLLSHLVLNVKALELDDLSPTGKWEDLPFSFRDLPRKYVYAYAFNDIKNLFPILEVTESLVDKTKQRFIYDLEVMFQRCVGYQEFWGYRINLNDLEKTKEEILKIKAKSFKRMMELVGYEFNPESPQQLLDAFHFMGHDISSTNKESLDLLPEDDEFVKAVRTYKGVAQTWKLFIKPMPNQLIDDCIYPSTMAMGADTGRASASNPNYMQVDDHIRAIIASRDGFKFLDTDLAQIEYRVNASVSEEPALLEMFEEPWNDFHTYQTGQIYDIPYELVPHDLRKKTKSVNFGMIFGMGDGLLGYHVFGVRNKDTREKARQIRRKIFSKQRNVERFFNTAISSAQQNGFTRTMFGRLRFFDIIKNGKDSVVTQASNAIIQGTATDIFKIACVRYFLSLLKYNLLDLVRFIAFVHDELLDEFSVTVNPYFLLKLKRECFEYRHPKMCAVYCGCGIGDTWLQAKSDDSEMNTVLGHELYYKADSVFWKDSKYYVDKDFTELFQEELMQFRTKVVVNYLTNPDNNNKVIQPHVYAYLNTYFAPSICEFGKKIKDCIKKKAKSCSEGGDFSKCVLSWKLHDYLENFINNYVPSIRDKVVNVLDPSETRVQENSETKKGEEITNQIDFSASVDDYLLITGYYIERNKLIINVASLTSEYTKALAKFLEDNAVVQYEDGTLSRPLDSTLQVELVFVNYTTAQHLKGYLVSDAVEMNLIKFLEGACISVPKPSNVNA